jgi:hypothetical protein
MNTKTKTFAAIFLILFSVFGSSLNISNIIYPTPPAMDILDVSKPHQEVIDRVTIFSDIVTDPDDRAKIAIFNYEFAERVMTYKATSQQVNDVYALAGKTFFKKELVDKYDGLAEEIIKLMTEIMSEENHELNQFEKDELHEFFMGIAWVLIQKG